jgi:hypothetical protein
VKGAARGWANKLAVLRRSLKPDRRWIAVEYASAKRGGLWLALGYARHLVRAPLWAVRAWRFRLTSRGERRSG